MPIYAIAFLLGNVLVHYQQNLLTISQSVTVLLIIFTIVFIAMRYKSYISIGLMVILGVLITTQHLKNQQSKYLPESCMGHPIQVEGFVYTMPAPTSFATAFIFDVVKTSHGCMMNGANSLVHMTWYGDKVFRVGDYYRFWVKLKKIHGLSNPGAISYESLAFANHVVADGYIQKNKPFRLINHDNGYNIVGQLRQNIQRNLFKTIPKTSTSGWIPGLLIGDRSQVNRSDWVILQATGTSHLLAIAGLHVGLIAGIIYQLCYFVSSRSIFLATRIPAKTIAALAAIAASWVYAVLAGFSMPTQRASIMLTCYLLAKLVRLSLPLTFSISLAFLIIQIVEPSAILMLGFWFSFLAICILIYTYSFRLNTHTIWWRYLRAQWVVGVGLAPITAYAFHSISIVSFFANTVAIPYIGYLVLPLNMAGLAILPLSSATSSTLFYVSDRLFALIWQLVTWLAGLPYASVTYYLSTWQLFLASISVCLFLAPAGLGVRFFSIYLLLPLVFTSVDKPEKGAFWATFLDVGQGLSVVIQTNQHILLYDTGARLSDSFDMGRRVITPYLRSVGVTSLDMVVISHADNDHAGGLGYVRNQFYINKIISSNTIKVENASPCYSGQTWQWDGVTFEMLSPDIDSPFNSNNKSCVLYISNNKYDMLLTGDIEKMAQRALLKRGALPVNVTLMSAPHHGSKTSADMRFLKTVQPGIVVYSTGYMNKYKMPHKTVTTKYKKLGVIEFNTVDTGAIQFKLAGGDVIMPHAHRGATRHIYSFN